MTSVPILKLSNELLRLILDQIEPDPDKTVPVDRRRFLSVESFEYPQPSTRGSIKDVGSFRASCKRFSAVGAPLQYARVAARFSKRGLEKLEQLADWPHLAQHVKKFSYLVPYFYGHAGQQTRFLLPQLENGVPGFDLGSVTRKALEQRQIVESKEDVRVLKKAVAGFTSLQHVQILRVQDEEDNALLSWIRQHDDASALWHLEWAPACSHGSQTIGAALLAADVPWTRFSSPMLSPQSAEFLALHKPRSLPTLAERLTCLVLHFDDGSDLNQKMKELSPLFRTVFSAAINMQMVHVGFPMHRPLSLPLEDVFHGVTWPKLVAFGVQGWRLDAEEIINLALRHRERLKGLRLRDVLLKEGSKWKDVLGALRDSMYRLDWVSLRRIGYAAHFDEEWLVAGAEVPDDLPPGESESDSDSDDDIEQSDDVDNEYPYAGPSNYQHQTNGSYPDSTNGSFHHSTDSDIGSEFSDSEHGPDAHEMDFPPLSPGTPASAPWCNCDGRSYPDTAEDLGDDGYLVSNSKRKAWEKWVVRRCPEHSER